MFSQLHKLNYKFVEFITPTDKKLSSISPSAWFSGVKESVPMISLKVLPILEHKDET